MAAFSSSGGGKSPLSLIQVLSQQNSILRGDEEGESSAPSLKPDAVPDAAPPPPPAPTPAAMPPGVQKRVTFYESLAGRVVAGDVPQAALEETLSSYPEPEFDASLFLMSPEGLPSQERINEALERMAKVHPDAIIQGTPLSFKVAMLPLYRAQRNGNNSKVRAIAKDILKQFAGQEFGALQWLRSLAK